MEITLNGLKGKSYFKAVAVLTSACSVSHPRATVVLPSLLLCCVFSKGKGR